MEKVNRVIIFTEGGDNIGFGHITRCSALYEEIESRGIEVEFVVFGKNVEELLKDKKYQNINWKNKEFLNNFLREDDYVIIDSYLADLEIYKYISEKAKQCLYIDDNNRIKYPKGIILNPVLYDDIDYQTENRVLQGKDYIILRKEFIEDSIEPQEKNIDVLITLGGTDIRNLTPKLLQILKELNSELKIAVVIGKAFDNVEEIKEEKSENTELYYNLTALEMKKVILRSKFVICGCGQSIHELLYLKANFFPIIVADNQERNMNFLYNLKIVDKKIDYKFSLIEIKNNLMNFIERNSKKLNLIDGNGIKRIVNSFLWSKENKIVFKNILDGSLEEQKEIRNWRNSLEIRKFMYNNEIITKEMHLNWLQSLKRNNEVETFFIIFNGKKIGIVNIKKISKKTYNWGIYLNSLVEKGIGIGKQVGEEFLKFLFNNYKELEVVEYDVLSENIPSLKLAISLGMKKYKEERNILIGKRVLNITYLKITKDEWRKINEKSKDNSRTLS